MVKCYQCDWEGEEEQMIPRESGLFLYDYIIRDKMKMDVRRENHHCPKCDAILVSHRLIEGMVFDGG